jgi:hypothetical protein
MSDEKRLLEAELEYHEKLYSGFAQKHFAKPAVRALREHMVARICRLTSAGASSRVLASAAESAIRSCCSRPR